MNTRLADTSDLPPKVTPGETAEEQPAGPHRAAPPAERSLLHYLGISLSIVLLLVVLAIGAAAVAVPRIAGATPLTVLTSSMKPHYPPGTLVVVRPVPVEQIQVGDVITYQLHSGEPAVVTHRVVEKGLRQDGQVQFITQGDNNPVPDAAPVREVQVRGRLWYAIPYLGRVNSWVGGAHRGAILPVVAGLLLAYGAWMIARGIRERTRPSQPTARHRPARANQES